MKHYDTIPLESSSEESRLPYDKPVIQRVELAIDETLSSGCKLGSDSGCVGPPVTAFDGGS
jgi:hypothetical protein